VSPRLPTPTPTATLVRTLRESGGGFDAATRDRLHAVLTTKAAQAGVLDVAYRTVDSPLGPLLLASTPLGLVRVAFAVEGHDEVLGRLAADVSPRILAAPQRLDDAARQLDDYFARRRRAFDLPIDLRLARGFRRTASYAAVAGASGNPAAVRAAASACSHNPLPLVVPCHRVVRSDGTIGNYLAGTAAKQALLDLEAAA
jgi:methylated-DNA-[protein]-cysteine S-methyltransferase